MKTYDNLNKGLEKYNKSSKIKYLKNGKVKKVKNVWVKQCFRTIFVSLIAVLVFLVPFTFGKSGVALTYKLALDKSLFITNPIVLLAIDTTFKLPIVTQIFSFALNYDALIYLCILAFNVLASLLLIITRSVILRVFFKIISIFAGFAMLLIALVNIVHIVFIIIAIAGNINPQDPNFATTLLETSGIIFNFATCVMAFVLTKKQFIWFSKLW